MIKLNDKNGDIKDNHQDAWEAMREFVKRRVDERYFDNIETIDFLIHHSGGHLRDLIRLLENCVNNTFGETNIDMAIATESAKQIATIYQRDLEKNDIETLVEIDLNLDSPPPKTETTVRLLEKLLLLEYNSYWWRSHPLIQMLPVYQKAKQVHLTNHANP